jgi:uncharacterized protein
MTIKPPRTNFKIVPASPNCPKSNSMGVLSEICNWTNSSLIAKTEGLQGLGVFTTAPVAKGDLLIVFGGRVLTSAQTNLMPPDLDMLIQIEDDLFFIPINLESLGIGERINHSCRPNAGFSGQMSVVAMRNIEAGEEICIDYATCDARPEAGFECECGHSTCRGSITGNDWLIPTLQNSLFEYFQPFLKRRIALTVDFKRHVANT